jgi:hypothetical protein
MMKEEERDVKEESKRGKELGGVGVRIIDGILLHSLQKEQKPIPQGLKPN